MASARLRSRCAPPALARAAPVPYVRAMRIAQDVRAGLADGVAYIDGGYRPIGEAKISVLDWGFLHSDATYDVVHVWRGRFFRLDAHLERFAVSMAKSRLSLPLGRGQIAAILHECVARSGLRDASVRMICTRGTPPADSRDPRAASNRFIAFAIPFVWMATEEQRERGLHMIVASVARTPPESVDPTVKNHQWLDLTGGLFEALDRGGETVVLSDGKGGITEGPGFNVFAVSNGAVATPARGVLEGVTRRTVLELCAELGVPAEPTELTARALRTADEVFVTSTAGGVIPVTKIDGTPVGGGGPGPITRRLFDLYWHRHDDPKWATPVKYP